MSDIEVIKPEVLEAQASAEINQQIATAKKYPRQLDKVKNTVLALATTDKETAESCFYALPRGDKIIEGESVRLAELVTSCWQNVRTAKRIISVDKVNGVIKAQADFIDLENNIAHREEIERSIRDKNGQLYKHDMIVMTGRAAQSVALRNAIFTVIPKVFFKSIIQEVKKVASGASSGVPLAERIEKAFNFFNNKGVNDERILASLNVQYKEDLTEDHLSTLLGINTAIKDGETTLEEAFPPTKKENAKSKANDIKEGVTDKLKDKANKK